MSNSSIPRGNGGQSQAPQGSCGKSSELPGFYKLDMVARRALAAEAVGLPPETLEVLSAGRGLADTQADHMVENAVGVMGLPLGLCVNMLVNGKDHIVPMAVEEPSVVAACSYASKLLRQGGGIRAEVSAPLMIGQIQVLDVPHPDAAEHAVLAHKAELVAAANSGHHGLVSAGGGVVDVVVRHLPADPAEDALGPMMVVHLVVDVRDAMGANAINTMCEKLAPRVAELTGGRVGLRILSNLSDQRTVTVEGRVPVSALDGKGTGGGRGLAKAIEEASVFAERDPYRAATHNKGIMNGVDAVLIALGQDWRAIEAGAHAYAARKGRYTALARWRVEGEFLVGRMTLPMAVGTVGGVVNVHPAVKVNRQICTLASTSELAAVITAAGLAQNLSALRALSAEGIQSGHMRLHARNVAIQAGATEEEVARVACAIADKKSVNAETARAVIAELRGGPREAEPAPAVAETAPEEVEPAPQSSCGARSGGGDLALDRAFCFEVLPSVSRTFALSIQALPESLRDAICVAYLLCRIVDTVEDDRRLAPSVRGTLFDAFDDAMRAATEGDASLATKFEMLSVTAGLGPKECERLLCDRAGSTFRTYAALSAEQREAIAPSVLEMSRGMRLYSERADAEGGLRLRNVPDLEKYCYYVAGTVGELLTKLFAQSFPVSDGTRAELEARAVSFGLGLQLVNILKDVAEDAERGDCFLPKAEADEHGIALTDLLVPAERAKGLALLRHLSSRARHHLDQAEAYTLLWPAEAGPVRLFCSVPLALALATLREVELGDDALKVGRAPTVSRALVMKVFEDAVNACGLANEDGSRALGALFDRSRTGVIGRPARPSGGPASTPIPDKGSSTRDGVRAAGTITGGKQGESMSTAKTFGLQPRREFGGKVLVTGAAGHVGANLVVRLLGEGRDVRVLLREGSNNEAIDAIERSLGKKVERVMGDLRDPRSAEAAARGCEAIFHVAARVSTTSANERDLLDIYQCNVIGTANILRAAGEAGVKRTVVTGSLSAVGLDPEDPSRPCDESMPFYPFAEHLPYGRTKSLVEHETLKAVVEGVDAVIATSCAVLGPWDFKPSRMGRTLIDFAHGKLRAYLPGGFDFVNVKDLVDGHVLALERGRSGQRYILSTEFCSVDDLMDIFEEASGRPRPKLKLPPTLMAGVAEVTSLFMSTFFPESPQRFTPAAVRLLRMERRADTTKAQTELGYRPTQVRTAIHEAYTHFASRGLVPEGPAKGGVESVPPAAAEPTSTKKSEGAAA